MVWDIFRGWNRFEGIANDLKAFSWREELKDLQIMKVVI